MELKVFFIFHRFHQKNLLWLAMDYILQRTVENILRLGNVSVKRGIMCFDLIFEDAGRAQVVLENQQLPIGLQI